MARARTHDHVARAVVSERSAAIEAVPRLLEDWYAQHARDFRWRRGELSPWQVLVAEVCLQQTMSPRVDAFLPGFFARFPDAAALAAAPRAEVEAALRPLGFQRKRAAVLQGLAQELAGRGIPRTREGLLALPGVGQYVASAYLCAVHGDATFLLDVNFARIVERVFAPRLRPDLRDDPVLEQVGRALAAAARDPRRFNWAMLDLGALVCRPTGPRCDRCPLVAHCAHAAAVEE